MIEPALSRSLETRSLSGLGLSPSTPSIELETRNVWPPLSTIPTVKLLNDGQFVTSAAQDFIEVRNPATQELLSRVPVMEDWELDNAVRSAKDAFSQWSRVPVSTRVRHLQKLLHLIQEHKEELVDCITRENGKTIADAQEEIFRGVEAVEMATSVMHLLKGEYLEQMSNNIDCYSMRQPLGVCSGICPSNFPAMAPLWLFPISIACGNCFILKPSGFVPGAAMMLAALSLEAGIPRGVINVVHGSREIVASICDHPDIASVSFMGSNEAGRRVYARACANGKRAQAHMGGKNHAIVMPDANIHNTAAAIISAAFGLTGQNCMAISVAVFVGNMDRYLDVLVKQSRSLKVTAGTELDVDLGPVITKRDKACIEGMIARAIDDGCGCPLNGSGIDVPGYPHGNFIGPTILTNIQLWMECYKQEIFGPVLCCMEVESLSDAIDVVNRHPMGNSSVIFTQSGSVAKIFQQDIEAGMVGINVPVPVPLPCFSFTGWKRSMYGDSQLNGQSAVDFFTRTKTVTAKWQASNADLPNVVALENEIGGQ